MDMSRQADDLRKAMKGFGTDEKALIAILAPMDPLQAAGTRQAFNQRHRRDLLNDLESETSGYFRDGLLAMARGPLEQDVLNANKAIKGFGTKEAVLNDVLLGRSNADLNAIKAHYRHVYGRTLESDVKGDLSLKTERLFDMVLAARRNEESSPVIPQQIEADVNKVGADQVAVCAVLTSRSDGQLRAISQAYRQKYHRELGEVLKKNFSGHMEDALMFILLNAEDRAKHDAQLLEDAMAGMGTKDDLLVNRIVRIHWDKHRMSQARGAYRHFFQRDLADRIRGETKGDYEKLMVACVQSA
jgi:annexin A7/11